MTLVYKRLFIALHTARIGGLEAPTGGFAQDISLASAGAPAPATCSVSPSMILVNAKSPTTATVTVTTTARSLGLPLTQGNRRTPLLLLLVATSLFFLLLFSRRRLQQQQPRFRGAPAFAIASLACVALTLTSCGGGSSSGGGTTGTQPGSYAITFIGTFATGSTNLSHTTKVTLVVQ
jgi:hypothetical protein